MNQNPSQVGSPQQGYIDPTQFAQATGIPPGQPVQQTFQQPVQQQMPPQSTVQAMQYQAQPQYNPQVRTITPEEYNRQVEELAENKFKVRAQEVINNAVSAMKGVANNMFGNQQQQQPQYQEPSFWDTTTGKVAIGGIGSAVGIGGYKLISRLFGGNGGSGYNPSPQELNTVGEAVKTLLGR